MVTVLPLSKRLPLASTVIALVSSYLRLKGVSEFMLIVVSGIAIPQPRSPRGVWPSLSWVKASSSKLAGTPRPGSITL